MTDASDEKPVTVNPWDCNAVKHAVDDCVKQVFADKYGYVESYRLLDIRLTLSIISVCFAMLALIWDWFYPFPTSRPILIVCVCSYFVLMTILQLYTWYIEKGTFYVAIDRDPTGKRPDKQWMFSSRMNKFDHIYFLETRFFGEKGVERTASLEKSVTNWIDENGTIVQEVLGADVTRLHDSLADAKKRQ